MQKILLINGSPRKKGLTASLLSAFSTHIEALNEERDEDAHIQCTTLNLSEYAISHCTGCDACLRKPYECPLSENDDMGKIEKSMKDSAAIIMGAPSYFGAPPGIIKDLIDRSRPMKMNKYQLKDKLFSVLGTSGLKGGGANYVQDVLIHFGLIQGMIVVGSLGHPVLNANLPSETLQKEALTDFRKPSEPGKLARKNTKSLAERIYSFLKEEG